MFYALDCCIVKEHVQKMSVAEMEMLRCMSNNTFNDKIRNKYIHEKLEATTIVDMMKEK